MNTVKIPEDATNGDVIMMLFPDAVVRDHNGRYEMVEVEMVISKMPRIEICQVWYPIIWWNAHYRKGGSE